MFQTIVLGVLMCGGGRGVGFFCQTVTLSFITERAFHLMKTKEMILLSFAIAYTGTISMFPSSNFYVSFIKFLCFLHQISKFPSSNFYVSFIKFLCFFHQISTFPSSKSYVSFSKILCSFHQIRTYR